MVIFYHFGPLTLGHSFQCSPKVLKNELLLAVDIVIAIAEPLKTLLHRYAVFEEQDKGLFGRIVSKNWQFLFANIAIVVFARLSNQRRLLRFRKSIAVYLIYLAKCVGHLVGMLSYRDCASRRRGVVFPHCALRCDSCVLVRVQTFWSL